LKEGLLGPHFEAIRILSVRLHNVGVYHCDMAEKGPVSRDYIWYRRCYLKRAGPHEVTTFSRVKTGSMQFDGELSEHVLNKLAVAML
jgi:hypothetical protein